MGTAPTGAAAEQPAAEQPSILAAASATVRYARVATAEGTGVHACEGTWSAAAGAATANHEPAGPAGWGQPEAGKTADWGLYEVQEDEVEMCIFLKPRAQKSTAAVMPVLSYRQVPMCCQGVQATHA